MAESPLLVRHEWVAGLQLLEKDNKPLPGATIPRPWDIDARFKQYFLGGGVSKDITIYEQIAVIRHHETKQLFVAFRETIDTLYYRQDNPEKFPKWIMELQEKRAELRIFIYQVKCLPSKFAIEGKTEWWFKWLDSIETDWVVDSLTHYLLDNKTITKEMVNRSKK